MAGPFDFTGQNIESTYQRVLQTDGTSIYDGTGSLFSLPSAFPYTGSALITGSLAVTGSIIMSSSNYIRFINTGSGTNANYSDLSVFRYTTYDTPALKLIRPDGIGFTLYRQGSSAGLWVGDENGNRNMTLYSNAIGAWSLIAPGFGGDLTLQGGNPTSAVYASSIVLSAGDAGTTATASFDHAFKINGPTISGSTIYNMVSFQASGVEKAAIRYDGGAYFSSSVGIGTTSSAAALEIYSAQANVAAPNQLKFSQAGGNILFSGYNGTISDSFGLTLSTTAAFRPVRVAGTSGLYVGSQSGITTPAGYVLAEGGVSIGTSQTTASLQISGSSGSALLKVDSNSSSNIIYVSGSGFVGIGTNAPNTKLDVAGAIRTSTIVYTNNVFSAGASNTFLNLNGITNVTLGLHNANMPFIVSVTGGSEIMRISGSGNVGIGTSTPGAKLDVAGTTYLRGVALDSIFGYTGNNITYINAGYTSFQGNIGVGGLVVPSAQLHISGSPSQALLIASSSAGPALYVSGSGNIGIGTNTPITKLDVSGSARITNGLIISSSTTINDELVINIPETSGPIDNTRPAGFYKATVNGAVVFLPYYL